MDYTILHALNTFVVAHPLLAHTATLLATWIVPVIVAATVIPWLASGAGVDARKMATAGALAAAALAMGVNQVVGLLWQRPRPSVAHPGSIVPLAGISPDSSFPSDHAAAAFAIAVAALLLPSRRPRAAGARRRGGRVAAPGRRPTTRRTSSPEPSSAPSAASRWCVLAALWPPLVRAVARVTDPSRCACRGRYR